MNFAFMKIQLNIPVFRRNMKKLLCKNQFMAEITYFMCPTAGFVLYIKH